MIWIITLLAMASVGLLVLGVGLYTATPELRSRLAEFATTGSRRGLKGTTYFDRRVRPAIVWLSTRFPALRQIITPDYVEARLVHAGEPYNLDEQQFYGLQLLVGLLAAIPGFVVGSGLAGWVGALIGSIAYGVAGLLLPLLWLSRKADQRQQEIALAVPDLIDMLATSMAAGLGFDASLNHVVGTLEGPLAQEFHRFASELRLGVPRPECFKRLLARNSAEELQTVVGALVQAHELGVSVAETLQEQAEQMRERRLQRAKELGGQASPKIALVATVIIAPSVLCLFLSVMLYGTIRDLAPLLREFLGF